MKERTRNIIEFMAWFVFGASMFYLLGLWGMLVVVGFGIFIGIIKWRKNK